MYTSWTIPSLDAVGSADWLENLTLYYRNPLNNFWKKKELEKRSKLKILINGTECADVLPAIDGSVDRTSARVPVGHENGEGEAYTCPDQEIGVDLRVDDVPHADSRAPAAASSRHCVSPSL